MNTLTKMALLMGLVSCLTSFQTPNNGFPKNYFRSPVDGRIQLSGSFGELRSNHFHSGIDIKPVKRGQTGQNIYATATGYVSRIVVSHRGFGYGLYVTHPNGYTTVYGHLLKFNDKIERYIQQLQYEKKIFNIDIDTLPSNRFPVQKGEVIGYMGNSGSSGGAHLHFEIRNTKTGNALNPLLFGLSNKISDNIAPRLQELKVYYLNHKLETTSTKKYTIKSNRNKTGYYIPNNEITVQAGRVGLAVKSFDFMNGVNNWNGPFIIKVYQNDSVIYHFEATELSFDEWYYLNAHVDYREFKKKKSYFNRCYLLPGNGNSTVYKKVENQGVIELREGEQADIRITAEDVLGNRSEVRFKMTRKGTAAPPTFNTFNYILPYNERNAIRQSELELYFEEGSFYEDVYLKHGYANESSPQTYSAVHQIHDEYVPVHQPFIIKIRPNRPIPDSLKSKATIARCSGLYQASGVTSNWDAEGQFLEGKTRSFGDYCIMLDTLAPTIKPSRFKENMSSYDEMTFKVSDDLSGIASYEAYVDGEWILLAYDLKTRRLIYDFENGKIARGSHHLKLIVKDEKENVAVFEQDFVR